jgi:hypothetical protein
MAKYEIECCGMGCIYQSEMGCYNDLVNNYLKEIFNNRIVDYKKNKNDIFF